MTAWRSLLLLLLPLPGAFSIPESTWTVVKLSPQPPTSPQVAPLRARRPVGAPWLPRTEPPVTRLLVAGPCRDVSVIVAAVGRVRGWSWRGLPLPPLPLVNTFPAGQLDMFAAAAALVMGMDEGAMMPPPPPLQPPPPPPLDEAREGEALPLTAGTAARRRNSLPV